MNVERYYSENPETINKRSFNKDFSDDLIDSYGSAIKHEKKLVLDEKRRTEERKMAIGLRMQERN